MSDQRYWVIGGEFISADFAELHPGTARLFGPFASREEAETIWRDVSRQHGHEFRTRFAVVHEPVKAIAPA
jgi:hypothetical protein